MDKRRLIVLYHGSRRIYVWDAEGRSRRISYKQFNPIRRTIGLLQIDELKHRQPPHWRVEER